MQPIVTYSIQGTDKSEMYLTSLFLGHIHVNSDVLMVAFFYFFFFFFLEIIPKPSHFRKLHVAQLILDCDSVYKSKFQKIITGQ